MRITFLGTGAAGGVPLFGCQCIACIRAGTDAGHLRRPCCAMIETANTRVLLDAGLMNLHDHIAPGSLDAILLTHYHPDHVQGLFHLRWGVGDRIPVMSPADKDGCADLYRNPGLLQFSAVTAFTAFTIGELTITPLPLIHSRPTLGYAIEGPRGERFAYLTDTIGLPPATTAFLERWPSFSMALDCSFPPRPQPANHNDWDLALGCITEVKAQQAWLTHIGHQLDSWLLADQPFLPAHIKVAHDNLTVELAPTT